MLFIIAVYPRSPHLVVLAFSVMSSKFSVVLQELRHKPTAERLGALPDRPHYDVKCNGSLSNYFGELKHKTSWMKCAAVAKVVRPNSDVTQDICPKVHGNPSSSCWDMSAWTAGPSLKSGC